MDDELNYQKVLAKLIFQSPDEAAVHVLNKISEPHYEMGGVVYQGKDGFYGFSDPGGDERTGKFRAEARIPKGSKPVAIYHTHPGYGDEKDLAEKFSPDDINAAKQMKLLSYIRAMNSGNIRRFEPGVTPVNTQGVGLRKTSDATGNLIYAKTENK